MEIRMVIKAVKQENILLDATISAKKNGKSTWLAAIALYLCFIDGEMGAEVYTAATSAEQAKIVFNDASKMVEYSPKMRAHFGIEFSKYSVFQTETNSVLKALSQDRGGTKDGLNVHMAVIDELHAHKDSSMYDITADGIAARSQPLVGAISTAGDDNLGVCYRERTTVENGTISAFYLYLKLPTSPTLFI